MSQIAPSPTAAVLIIGYGFNFETLQTLVPGFPAMKPRTAAVLMALSVSFLMSLRASKRSHWGSAAIAVLTLVFLIQSEFSRYAVSVEPWGVIPSQATIFCLALAAITLIVINLRPRWSLLAGILALVAATPAMFRILGLALFGGALLSEWVIPACGGSSTAVVLYP